MNTDKIYAEAIANEYSVKTSRKVVALRKLDRWVKRPAKMIALTVGITSFTLNILGLALLSGLFFPATMICNLSGIIFYAIGIAVSPVVYKKVFEYRKRENAFDVVELAKEVIKIRKMPLFNISQTFLKQLTNTAAV